MKPDNPKKYRENCPANGYDNFREEYRCMIDNSRCDYKDDIRQCNVYQRFVMPRRSLR